MITFDQALIEPPPPPLIHYIESDGKPMGENDQQRNWIVRNTESKNTTSSTLNPARWRAGSVG
ncbi:MAG: hypothetical protein FJ398_17610 [Verrucomicrobia bacterium]|nr:hypothetical protein [Verrucomicrobiota bacterium]